MLDELLEELWLDDWLDDELDDEDDWLDEDDDEDSGAGCEGAGGLLDGDDGGVGIGGCLTVCDLHPTPARAADTNTVAISLRTPAGCCICCLPRPIGLELSTACLNGS